MTLNSIRKLLFTNLIVERLFIFLTQKRVLQALVIKLIPINTLYKKNTIRAARRNGITYRLDISDYQAWLIYYMSKEDSSLKVLEYLGESEVILDIGANIGQTALEINKNRLAKNKVYQIFCFEPFSENYLSLKKNIELNEPHSIIAENIGLGRTNANVNMFKDCISNSGGNRVVHTSSVNTAGIEEVAISSLDAYLNKNSINKIDFVKIDVEGYEFEVLSGALNTLKSQKPKLFIELDDKNLRSQGSSAKELLTFLEELNYSITDSNKQFSIAELKESSIHTDIYCE